MDRIHKNLYTTTIAFIVLSLAMVLQFTPAMSAETSGDTAKSSVDIRTFSIKTDHSRVVDLPVPIKRVSTGNPLVADVVVVSPTQLYINARILGASNITMWDKSDRLVGIYEIKVIRDLDVLKERLHQLFPDEPIEVREMEGGVIMSGIVSSQEVKRKAEDLGLAFSVKGISHTFTVTDSKGKTTIHNVTTKPESKVKGVNRRPEVDTISKKGVSASISKGTGGQDPLTKPPQPADYPWFTSLIQVGGSKQIMLEVCFAEVNRNVLNRFTVNLGFQDGAGNFAFTFLKNLVFPTEFDLGPTGEYKLHFAPNLNGIGGYETGLGKILGFVDILKENGVARILAEPNLLATSGEKAEFLAGGEFPVPIPSRDGISVSWKPFGVQLRFLPEIMANGKIKLQVEPEVSDLDYSTAVIIQSYTVPGITTRRTSTQLELEDGQSFAIAGLLKDDLTQVVAKIPLLGDIPILGSLFRSTNYQSKKTDLMIVVTPRIVRNANQYSGRTLPTDGVKIPNDWDLYMMGKLTEIPEHDRSSTKARDNSVPASMHEMEGVFGHEWID